MAVEIASNSLKHNFKQSILFIIVSQDEWRNAIMMKNGVISNQFQLTSINIVVMPG